MLVLLAALPPGHNTATATAAAAGPLQTNNEYLNYYHSKKDKIKGKDPAGSVSLLDVASMDLDDPHAGTFELWVNTEDDVVPVM